MNKARRLKIRQAIGIMGEAHSILDLALSEEESAQQNLPESFECGDQWEIMENAIFQLEEAIDHLDSALGAAMNACGR